MERKLQLIDHIFLEITNYDTIFGNYYLITACLRLINTIVLEISQMLSVYQGVSFPEIIL